ncbi:glycosyltransferase family 2 protein [Deinococcus aerophilus]|uniref:Biofilm formation protein PslC n=1 Tax=Deinococcus aerophilus TaxID=522488 RepID=A0ABQ2GXK5_9DEIO|nr:glycosyltransferase [Deinococcus aerophilus]GGM18611.1 biofilm formation protein PslC [Deinococcus aerophilus]
MTPQSIFLIVPTLDAARHVPAFSAALNRQTRQPDHVLILDSASADNSPQLYRQHGFEVVSLVREGFNHGGTRNRGAHLACAQGAQILVFMTQDAIPAHDRWLEELVAPILAGKVAATFARQLPRPGASLLEQFSRYFNYPDSSRLRREANIQHLGVKAFFFSNVCSAVRADLFWLVGGFPEGVIMNEDMILAARLLRAGQATEYVAQSQVVHSHDYTLTQQFRRNFDVGVSFSQAGPLLNGARVGGEGLRFVAGQMRYVLRHGHVDLVPLVLLEAAAKFTAFQTGKRHRLLPIALKKILSMHRYHWSQERKTS